MADKRNDLRIPFAEWLYRMYEAELPPQARALAVYVAAFKIGNNDELSALSGIADKTYIKWKKELLKDGWVIVSRKGGGRGIGIEVHPAYKETLVTFTDLVHRNSGKFNPGNEDGDTPVNNADTGVKNTPVSKEKIPHTPLKENTNKNKPLASQESGSPRELAGLNGSADPMISDIVGWMPGGTETLARNWLKTMVSQLGQDAVRRSYLKLKTDLACGSLIAQPLQTWPKIAHRMKAEPASAATPEEAAEKDAWQRQFIEDTLKGVRK